MRHQRNSSHASRRSSSYAGTTLNLFIPSLHDAANIETSLLVPAAPSSQRKAAVFAHPYGPLGGSLHDAVVQYFTSALVSRGYIVAIFNFRGVGHSKGHTTWTGRAETGDYAAIAAWVLNFAAALHTPELQQLEEIQLLLCGYSYGGLIAAQCPPVSSLLNTISSPPSEGFRAAVKAGTKSAECWYQSRSETGRTSYSGARPLYSGVRSPGMSPTQGGGQNERLLSTQLLSPQVSLEAGKISTWYLLVSPPLPPVSTFLLPSFSFSASAESVMTPAVATSRPGTKVLAAWGDVDNFTGVKKYRRWSEKMKQELGEEGFEGVEVGGMGHFWGQRGLKEVDDVLERWLVSGV